MSASKVELGRRLFYDKRMSRNGKQSCASCHREDDTYKRLFPEAYPGDPQPFSIANVSKAVAAFERTIISANYPYDRFRSGDEMAISESAKRGMKTFFSEKTACSECHGNFTFGGDVRFEGGQEPNVWFFNTAVTGSYADGATGLHEHTLNRGDIGRFRPPTLRNVALTGPYMHDGSIATLAETVDHYAAGGRTPNVRNRSNLIRGFQLLESEKDDLINVRVVSAMEDQWTQPVRDRFPVGSTGARMGRQPEDYQRRSGRQTGDTAGD